MSDRVRFTIFETIIEDGGEEVEVEAEHSLPGKFEVCDRCRGRGHHDHPAFSGGFTAEDFYEEGPDFVDDYMAGVYDVPCEECGGRRVVLVVDEERSDPETLAKYRQMLQDKWEAGADERAERAYFRRFER